MALDPLRLNSATPAPTGAIVVTALCARQPTAGRPFLYALGSIRYACPSDSSAS